MHGDDFTITGSEKDLSWLKMLMTTRYEIKSEMLGPEAHMSQEIRVLNRILRWTPSGVEYEPDQRHAEVLIQAMGMLGAKPVATPGVTGSQTEVSTREKSRPLTGKEASSYEPWLHGSITSPWIELICSSLRKKSPSQCRHHAMAIGPN